MAKSVNGWPVLIPGSSFLHGWVLPDVGRTLTLRNGSAGFLLAHAALWWHEEVEPITGGAVDEGGYAYRPIAGTSSWSNHASGTAVDINWHKHPQHVEPEKNFSKDQIVAIRRRYRNVYDGCLVWGGDWSPRYVDPMHTEIAVSLSRAELRAKGLMDSPRGVRLLKANPTQRKVILS